MLEKELGLEAERLQSLQKVVENTLSDNTIIKEWIGIYPKTSFKKGIKKLVDWYKDYYK